MVKKKRRYDTLSGPITGTEIKCTVTIIIASFVCGEIGIILGTSTLLYAVIFLYHGVPSETVGLILFGLLLIYIGILNKSLWYSICLIPDF